MKKGIKIALIAACCVIVALIITFIVLWKQFEAGLPTVENQVTPTGIVSVTPDNPTSVPTSVPETPTNAPTTAPSSEPDVTDAPIAEPTDTPVITDTPAEPTDTPVITESPNVDESGTDENPDDTTPTITNVPTVTEAPAVPTATPTATPTPTVTPTPAPSRNYVYEVKMGDNVWYRLTDDGVFYMTGTGANYGLDYWYEEETDIIWGSDARENNLRNFVSARHLIIEEGITKLSAWSLKNLPELITVTFPSTLTEIEDYCFWGTAKTVNSVFIGLDKSKVKLGDRAFYGTTYQTEADLEPVAPSPTPTPITEPIGAVSFYKTLVEEAGISIDTSKAEPYSAALVAKGILSSTDVRSETELLTNQEVAKLLYNTATVYGIQGDEAVISSVKDKERISDRSLVGPGYMDAVYFCFGSGIMPGVSDGEYSHTRSFAPKEKVREADGKTYCKRLFDENIRVLMSPDGQVIRTTNLPVQAKLYPYILESFPNVYYDTPYLYMYNMNTDDRATMNAIKRNCFLESWCTPNTMKEYGEKQPERCYWFNDMENYLGYEKVGADFLAERYGEQWEEDAKRYLELILNFDYKTVREDTEWQEEIKNLNVFYTEIWESRVWGSHEGKRGIDRWMENFLTCAEEHKTTVQCSAIDFDMSTLMYSEQFTEYAPFTVRVHLRYKIDTEYEPGWYFTTNNLVLPMLCGGVETSFESFGEWKDVYAEIAFGVNCFDRSGVAGLRITEGNADDPIPYHFDPKDYVD